MKIAEAAVWKLSEHIVPILQSNSCLPFLLSLSEYITFCRNEEVIFLKYVLCFTLNYYFQISLKFLQHENIQCYLQSLRGSQKYNAVSNWFTRIESQLIINILKTAVLVQKDLNTRIFYEVAVKCLSIFGSESKCDVEFILRNIIFCRNFYPCEVLIDNLDLSNDRDVLKITTENLENIFEVYCEILALRKVRDIIIMFIFNYYEFLIIQTYQNTLNTAYCTSEILCLIYIVDCSKKGFLKIFL